MFDDMGKMLFRLFLAVGLMGIVLGAIGYAVFTFVLQTLAR